MSGNSENLAANSENLLQLTRRVTTAHPGLRVSVHVGVGHAAAAERRRDWPRRTPGIRLGAHLTRGR